MVGRQEETGRWSKSATLLGSWNRWAPEHRLVGRLGLYIQGPCIQGPCIQGPCILEPCTLGQAGMLADS